MNNKFQPSDDLFDDVEGHDASGKAMPAEDDDTEGHAARGKALLPEDDEDVEGHALKTGRPILPGERGRRGSTYDR